MLVKNPSGRIVGVPDEMWPKLQKEGFVKVDDLSVPRGMERDTKDLSVIILAWNRLELTKKCLASVLAHTDNPNMEVIIVDQASTDGTTEWLHALEKENPHIRGVYNTANRGVAGGRNDGILAAKGRFLAFFDNDSTVGPKWWRMCAEIFDANPRIGFVGRLGTMFHSFTQEGMRLAELPDNMPVQCDVVSGGATVIRREVFAEIGLLDEWGMGHFWHEDSELCLRAKLAGWYSYAIKFPWEHDSHASWKAEKGDKWMDGFQANLDYIVRKLKRENVITIHRDYHGEACMDSLCIVATNLTNELRKLGWVVLRKPTKDIAPIALRICTGFVLEHRGKEYWWTHQENDRAPLSWLKPLEDADFILPPSNFCAMNLTRSGVPVKKFADLSPNGVDPSIFNPRVKAAIGFETFLFFANGATQPRKGTDILLEAYFEEFTDEDACLLFIKDGNYGHRRDTRSLIAKLQAKYPHAPQVVHTFDYWTPERLAAHYRRAALNGAFVNPHRSEGFGLCILEAMACGSRVITTAWGGNMDFCQYQGQPLPGVTLIEHDLIPSTFHNNPTERYYQKDESPHWAEPRKDDLRRAMRAAFEDRRADLTLIERDVSADKLLEYWSFGAVAKRFDSFFKTRT